MLRKTNRRNEAHLGGQGSSVREGLAVDSPGVIDFDFDSDFDSDHENPSCIPSCKSDGAPLFCSFLALGDSFLVACPMVPRPSDIPIIRTKLHRPSAGGEVVRRDGLLDRLERGIRRPLGLVCGPAGSGKTTLVSQWLEDCRVPNAWLSLEDEDSDLRVFVAYFIAAVRTAVPNACPETAKHLSRLDLPVSKLLADSLRNDLDAIGEPLILVLDDYHRVRAPMVHELLDRFLDHGPPGFHLVILARRDPPLSVATLRARGQLTEIRIRDLRFKASETVAVIEQAIGRQIDPGTAEHLQKTTEGWAVIVRLAALALRDHKDLNLLATAFGGGTQEVQDYLLTEVLAPLDPAVRDCLCYTSILNRLCAPLCEALCRRLGSGAASDGEVNVRPVKADTFLRALRDSGLPFSVLDEGGEWIRYHHLIQDLLQRHLHQQHSAEEIAALHRTASTWFEEHEFFEEAIQHALKSGDPHAAGRIVIRHRFDLTAKEQWVRLIRWLQLLPEAVVNSEPELLIAYARTCDKRGVYSEWVRSLERAEKLLGSMDCREKQRQELRAEIAMMRSLLSYHAGDAPTALQLARQALDNLPERAVSEHIYATLGCSMALQMMGSRKEAYQFTYEALQGDGVANPTGHGRLMQALSFLGWIDADLPTLARTGKTMLAFGQENDLSETVVFARYFLGAALYHQDALEAAEEHLLPVAEDPNVPGFFMHVMAVQALALVRQARGDRDGAAGLAERLLEHILNSGSTSFMDHAQALRAELALSQGRIAEAVAIAEGIETSDAPPGGYHFAIPELTVAKVLVREGSESSLARAGTMLEGMATFYESTHNRIHQIQVLALQAVLDAVRGDATAGAGKLAQAVSWAQSGGVIRLFVDLGPEITPLLNRIEVDADGLRYVGRILAAFRKNTRAIAGEADPSAQAVDNSGNHRSPIETLTGREQEILTHLARSLSNKEIAAALFISPGTVKRHTNSIYGKLAVHGRIEAVAKAQGLGILST